MLAKGDSRGAGGGGRVKNDVGEDAEHEIELKRQLHDDDNAYR